MPVDNPARTTQYLAQMAERRRALRQQLAALFPSPGTFVWELGCGHGHFLTAYAQAHPEKLCIGVDIVSERIERAQRKRERAKLANLAFVQAEARLFLEMLPAHARCSAAFILFPDPWPKLRHHKHRIMQPTFLTALAARSASECRLYFRTDFAPYFEDARQVVGQHPRWTPVEEPWPFEFATVFQSRAPAYQSLVARYAAP
jgi:tRNA (guanine-N7-)-methyltransferase